MQRILFLLFILIYSISFSQIDKKLLEGDWIVYKRDQKDGSKYFSNKIIKNPFTIFSFINGSYTERDYITDKKNWSSEFKFENNKLIFSKKHYLLVEKLTESDLIFVDFSTDINENNLTRYYMKRYEKQQDQDIITNKSKDTLFTTPTLSPFPKKDVFNNIFESQPNFLFRAKGYLIFNMQDKYVKAIITESTDISSQDKDIIYNTFSSNFDSWNFQAVKNFKIIKMPFILLRYKYSMYVHSYSHTIASYNQSSYDEIVPPSNGEDIDESDKTYFLGIKCFENKKYDCALMNFKRSYEKNKYNLDSHYNYATISFSLGKKNDACKKWKELIEYGQKEAEREYQQNNCNN